MSSLKEQVEAIVREVARIDRSKSIDSSATLKELGVDSLEVANVFLNIAERYHVEVPDSEIDRLTTITQITEYLEPRVGKA